MLMPSFDDLWRNRRLILISGAGLILGLFVFICCVRLILWTTRISMPLPAEPAHTFTEPCQNQHSQKQDKEHARGAGQPLPD